MSAVMEFDLGNYRQALGAFATGVTIVTTCTEQGDRTGITANSFNSVSMSPPLVLWSLDSHSGSKVLFDNSPCFTVNILASTQTELAKHFAKSGIKDKFTDTEFTSGITGCPVLTGCAATFQCRKKVAHEEGDHTIYIGEVLDYELHDRQALIYHRSEFGVVSDMPSTNNPTAITKSASVCDFYLEHVMFRIRQTILEDWSMMIEDAGLTDNQWKVLNRLIENLEPIRLSLLSNLIGLDQSLTLSVVGELEKLNWLTTSVTNSSGDPVVLLQHEGYRKLLEPLRLLLHGYDWSTGVAGR